MPDHIHLLLSDEDLVEFVRHLKGRISSESRRHERKRRMWQRSFFDHALRKEESVFRVAQYVFENPVRAELAKTPDEYLWSGSTVWPEWRKSYS